MNDKTIDPKLIPSCQLYTGSNIHCIGLGTFCSDSVTHKTIAATFIKVIYSGYCHTDCVSEFGNEKEIGSVFKEIFNSGFVNRENMWITSRVWNDIHDKVIESCKNSLRDLRLDYLDLYMVHWQFPDFHPPKYDVTSLSSNAKTYIYVKYLETLRQMEKFVEMGLIKNIGTSNMTIPKMKLLLMDAKIRPSCNEMEQYPRFQQEYLFNFCLDNDIRPIAYCPIGLLGMPECDRTPEDTVDPEDGVLVEISKTLNTTTSAAAIKWAVQRGRIPIPFSVNHFFENIESVININLNNKNMDAISKIEKNCRLIKGQVFFRKDNHTWEELWDLSGQITQV